MVYSTSIIHHNYITLNWKENQKLVLRVFNVHEETLEDM